MAFLERLNPGLIVDAVIAVIILFKLLQGRSEGAVKKLGRLAALVCAIFGADYIRDAFARELAEKYVRPFVYDRLSEQLDRLGLSDAVENLSALFDRLRLPQFLQSSVAERVGEESAGLGSSVGTAVSSASSIIAERVAGWLLLIAGFAVVYLVIKLLFDGMLDPVIRKLPLANRANSLLGAILGAVIGAILAGLLLVIVHTLAPSLSVGGKPLFSPEAVEKTYLLKLYFRALPGLLG